MTNFELGVRVPLMISVPDKPKTHGLKQTALVEAVDLYQTFVDLAGLPPVPATEGLEGASLAPLFDDPDTPIKQYAFSQFAKRNTTSKELKMQVPWDVCTTCKRSVKTKKKER